MLIDTHRQLFGRDPIMVTIAPAFREANSRYLAGKAYSLCCGRGILYRGIPMIYSSSPFVEDFLISY